MQKKGLSIKVITALYAVVAILVLTAAVVFIGYHLFENRVMESYEKYVSTVVDYAYETAVEYSFGDMIAQRSMADNYEALRERLNTIKESSDIKYLYAIYFEDVNDIHSLTYAINTKTAEELKNGGKYTMLGTPCEEGGFQEDTLRILQNAVKNRMSSHGILDGYSEDYGHMLNGYRVLFDSAGEPAGLLCVEIDINDISSELNGYVRKTVLFAILFTIIVTTLYIFKIEYSLIYPITSITHSAKDFIKNLGDQAAMNESVNRLNGLKIRSKNEVGDLYKTISKMETDMARQLNDIREYAEHNVKMQNGLMVLMADMVSVRDSDTGAHIQKTAAYVRLILEGLQRKGYYKEMLTPQYMEDVIKSAPLHDVGKINIPDAILNKVEQLTDEEFEIMKRHTTSGKEIIDKAITVVGGESYLREARNMAAYHHERWDGKGYPEGLSGEEIPLSARIMAVADVFDALTSPRIYKPAFPLERVVEMIEEDKEKKFDPKCVEVLIENLPEFKEVLKKLNPNYTGL